MGYSYRGFSISYSASRPVTGTWVGLRHGVEVCASSRSGLYTVIDHHEEDRKRHNERRAADELPERDFYEGDAPDF